jgi:hypothetical protein
MLKEDKEELEGVVHLLQASNKIDEDENMIVDTSL